MLTVAYVIGFECGFNEREEFSVQQCGSTVEYVDYVRGFDAGRDKRELILASNSNETKANAEITSIHRIIRNWKNQLSI